MQLALDLRIQGFMDIEVVDIPDQYGLLLRRELLRMLNGCIHTFSICGYLGKECLTR